MRLIHLRNCLSLVSTCRIVCYEVYVFSVPRLVCWRCSRWSFVWTGGSSPPCGISLFQGGWLPQRCPSPHWRGLRQYKLHTQAAMKIWMWRNCNITLCSHLPSLWRLHQMDALLSYCMMTSSNGNIFRFIGPLCGEFTGHRWIPRTKASDAELWCFLWSTPD